jgi:hypothetical protein
MKALLNNENSLLLLDRQLQQILARDLNFNIRIRIVIADQRQSKTLSKLKDDKWFTSCFQNSLADLQCNVRITQSNEISFGFTALCWINILCPKVVFRLIS